MKTPRTLKTTFSGDFARLSYRFLHRLAFYIISASASTFTVYTKPHQRCIKSRIEYSIIQSATTCYLGNSFMVGISPEVTSNK